LGVALLLRCATKLQVYFIYFFFFSSFWAVHRDAEEASLAETGDPMALDIAFCSFF
jgi:hypothetical protein